MKLRKLLRKLNDFILYFAQLSKFATLLFKMTDMETRVWKTVREFKEILFEEYSLHPCRGDSELIQRTLSSGV